MTGILVAAAALLGAADPEPGVLRGRAVDEAGNPVGHAAVLVVPVKAGEEEPPAEFTPPAVARPGDPGDRVPVWKRATLRADAEGRFRVEGLKGLDYWLLGGFEGMDEVWERVRPGGEEIAIRVPGPREISGVCVEEGTETPIAGMEFWVGPDNEGGMVALQKDPTDAEGRFRVRGLLAGNYSFSFASTNSLHPTSWEFLGKSVHGVKAGVSDLRVVLTRGLAITGKVLDDRGQPVAGITVEAGGQGDTGGWTMGREVVTRTGPDGSFRLPGLGTGLFGIKVAGDAERAQSLQTWARMDVRINERDAKEGREARKRSPDDEEREANERVTGATVERVKSGTGDLVVRVRRATRITGRVVDGEGKPLTLVEEVSLNIYVGTGPFAGSNLQGAGSPRGRVIDNEDKVMPDGTFRTRALEPGGTYDLVVFQPEERGSGAARGVRSGTSGVEIRLCVRTELSGVLLDAGGKPAGPGVPVRAVATGLDDSHPAGVVECRTGEGGAFVLRGLGEFSYRLESGGGESPWLVTPAPGEFVRGETGLQIVARPGAVISGRLVDGSGAAVRAVCVTAGAGPAFSVSKDGAFTVGGLAPGKVRLAAWIGDREVDLGEFEAPAVGTTVTVPGK